MIDTINFQRMSMLFVFWMRSLLKQNGHHYVVVVSVWMFCFLLPSRIVFGQIFCPWFGISMSQDAVNLMTSSGL